MTLIDTHFLGRILVLDISEKIAAVNAQLRDLRAGVTVGQIAGKLHLRGTLPPKPHSKATRPHQQRIYLRLPANPAGLRTAMKEARLVGGQLATREFDWGRYINVKALKPGNCGEWIEKFEHWYLNAKGGAITTWKGDYLKGFQGLAPGAELTPATMEAAILKTKPNTKSRVRACMAVGALAKFAEVDFDAKPLKGNYSPAKVQPRNLPTDAAIAQCRDTITKPEWRWVYGMMACYGLRNHEVFRLDLTEFPIVYVEQNTKTGAREVWPCYPEWAERWSLVERQLPGIKLDRTNEVLGRSVTNYLSPKLPFAPYDLRHCWAVRTLEYGWPDSLSAQQMGHSLAVHSRTYQRWIDKRHHQRVYDLLLKREDRPMPP
ncbi:MAG: site-specific integrase [Cyanobacteria bacterium P01_F01_bin.53]